MLETDINRLTLEVRLRHVLVGDESTEDGSNRQQPNWRVHLGSLKVPATISAFEDQVTESWSSEEIVGPSTDLERITVGLQIIAQTDSPVLIVGESGTCKEVIARCLHSLSLYSNRSFVHVNCQLARSEEILAALMKPAAGHSSRRLTDSGEHHFAARRTVFLEDVSKLSSAAQDAVVKVLQFVDGDRNGSASLAPRRIRLIASSEANLPESAEVGDLSIALYQHPETHLISIPSLRDRAEDLPMLVQRFLEQDAEKKGQPFRPLSNGAVELLQLYPWPGNLRELWDVMVSFVALREAGQLTDGSKPLSNDGPSLCREPEADREVVDLDDGELIVASLLQTISLRSRGASSAW